MLKENAAVSESRGRTRSRRECRESDRRLLLSTKYGLPSSVCRFSQIARPSGSLLAGARSTDRKAGAASGCCRTGTACSTVAAGAA